MTDDFLDKDYKAPETSNNYMKLVEGMNLIRCLARPIMGYSFWVTETNDEGKQIKKPRRFRPEADIPADELEGDDRPKHFWAMPVWNYNEKAIQILELTQLSIIREIAGLARDEDWGSPLKYDIQITRSGEGLKTKYDVKPKPHKPLDPEVEKLFGAMTVNLDAMYDNGDPFLKVDVSADDPSLDEIDVKEIFDGK